ncbi:MAG: ABC transporter permease, partial [Clostridia bacterium]|nr:ABC transporter permease [Clostridia bacterium]
MPAIITFLQNAIRQGICILFGANGEILTEKSGNLNLGVPGMMYMGGIAGLAAAFMYERGTQTPNPSVGFLLALIAALVAGGLGGLVYSVLTISLRANQNVSGLALTTFGVGLGNFFGGSLSKLAGGVGQISTAATASAFRLTLPVLRDIPVVGDVLFS